MFVGSEAAWKQNQSPWIHGKSGPYMVGATGKSGPYMTGANGISNPHQPGVINATNQPGMQSGNPFGSFSGFGGGSQGNMFGAFNGFGGGQSMPNWDFDGMNIAGLQGPISRSSSSNTNSSYSGLGASFIRQLMEPLMPALTDSINNMDSNIDKWTNLAQSRARNFGNSFVEDNMAGVLDELAAKGTLQSPDLGGKVIQGLMDSARKQSQDQVYNSGMNAAEMRYNLPSMYGNLANLGRYSEGAGSGTSSGFSSNDLAVPQFWQQLLYGLM